MWVPSKILFCSQVETPASPEGRCLNRELQVAAGGGVQLCAAMCSYVSSPAPLLTSSTEKIEVSADPEDCLHGADGSFKLQERKNWAGDKMYV